MNLVKVLKLLKWLFIDGYCGWSLIAVSAIFTVIVYFFGCSPWFWTFNSIIFFIGGVCVSIKIANEMYEDCTKNDNDKRER